MNKIWQTNTMDFCVYKIKLSDGSIYIGATKHLGNRLQQHSSNYKKLGIKIIMSGIIDQFSSRNDCSMMEQYYINMYSTVQDTNKKKGVYPTNQIPQYIKINHKIQRELLDEERIVSYMDLIESIAHIAHSSKEIKLFGYIFETLDIGNRLHINISHKAKELDVTRVIITKLLNRAVSCSFAIKEKSGVYFINPFIVKGSGFYSNANFEKVQQEWRELTFKQDLKDPVKSGLIIQAEELAKQFDLQVPISRLIDNEFFLSILSQHRSGKALSDKQIDALSKIY